MVVNQDEQVRGSGRPPEFIQPKTISEMSDEEYEALLSGIRDRRMILVARHTEAIALKNEIKNEKLQAKIQRYAGMIEKEITKVEKIDENIQLRFNQIRALRLEAIQLEEIEI